jgi:hypothetical protein
MVSSRLMGGDLVTFCHYIIICGGSSYGWIPVTVANHLRCWVNFSLYPNDWFTVLFVYVWFPKNFGTFFFPSPPPKKQIYFRVLGVSGLWICICISFLKTPQKKPKKKFTDEALNP